MRLMMIGKAELSAKLLPQFGSNPLGQAQFMRAPQRQGPAERRKATWGKRQIRLQETLKLDEWLLVKGNIIQVRHVDPSLVQTIGDRLARESRIALQACKALLLGGSHNLTVLEKGGRRVMIEG